MSGDTLLRSIIGTVLGKVIRVGLTWIRDTIRSPEVTWGLNVLVHLGIYESTVEPLFLPLFIF